MTSTCNSSGMGNRFTIAMQVNNAAVPGLTIRTDILKDLQLPFG